jgi:CRISP-associated protein Cas1
MRQEVISVKKLLNVIYVLSDNSYIFKEGETIAVKVGGKEKVRVPVHTVESIVCFGNTTVSTPLIAFCGEKGVGLTFLSSSGWFYGRVEGPIRGNVLLRKKQYEYASNQEKSSRITYGFILAKIANGRNILLRAARKEESSKSLDHIRNSAQKMADIAKILDPSMDIDSLRGLEGMAAKIYFSTFNNLLLSDEKDLAFIERSKYPPRDKVNALLSFTYALLTHDVRSSLESVGLDPAVGFLHAIRPGRPSLALDMMEELRSPLCDRFVISLINLKQIKSEDIAVNAGIVKMTDDARKKVISAWQKRKKESITHPFIEEKILIGLIPYVQAQLMARYIRGDLDNYPPFYWR